MIDSMQQLYFCRHGQSELNAQQVYAGQIDTPLTDLGREQARTAGEACRALAIDAIISSTMSRAKETATIIANAIGYPNENILHNEIFIEQSYGSLQGLPWSTPNPETYHDIESDEALVSRAATGLELLQTLSAQNILLVGHGSFARALMQVIDHRAQHEEPKNASVIKLL